MADKASDPLQEQMRRNVRTLQRRKFPRVTTKQIAQETAIGYTTLTNWLGGYASLGEHSAELIAEYFGLSLDQLQKPLEQTFQIERQLGNASDPISAQLDPAEGARLTAAVASIIATIADPGDRLRAWDEVMGVAQAAADRARRAADGRAGAKRGGQGGGPGVDRGTAARVSAGGGQ